MLRLSIITRNVRVASHMALLVASVSRLGMALAPRMAPMVRGGIAPTFSRFASNSNDADISDADKLKVQDIVGKLNQNPEIREILEQFQTLLVSKGFNPNQPPSFMEMMRLFSQKDVRELAGKLKQKFDEAGIKISPEDMGLFMKLFKQ
ncbi:CIC11C00000004733 [Sungouiella intermedia]|uniref:CIC11C00000004733 n=1 Tax=Sungouiella intermedia TaxID=45354 RepID=A0A1L0BNY2_9ASCO|nr:CIC11C00000004733 [[Candida] intermedia]